MAGEKISALPMSPGATNGDIFPVVQNGVNYQETLAQLITFLAGSFPTFTGSGITLTQAQVQGAYATPVQLVAAPGAGLTLVPIYAIVYTNFQTSAFAGGGNAIIQYGNTVHGGGSDALSGTIPSGEITAGASQLYAVAGNTGNALTGITNQGLFFSNATGPFTGGSAASTVVIFLIYMTITATT